MVENISHFHAYAILNENLWRGKYPPIDMMDRQNDAMVERMLDAIMAISNGTVIFYIDKSIHHF